MCDGWSRGSRPVRDRCACRGGAGDLACGLIASSPIQLTLINDWIPDDPSIIAAKAVLPEWVRWHGEQAGLTEHFVNRAVAVGADDIRTVSDCADPRASVVGTGSPSGVT